MSWLNEFHSRNNIKTTALLEEYKELRSYLPFYIIDKIENKLIKECKKLDEISYLFHDYKIQRPTSDVFVLDTQSRNFTNYFIDNIVQ